MKDIIEKLQSKNPVITREEANSIIAGLRNADPKLREQAITCVITMFKRLFKVKIP